MPTNELLLALNTGTPEPTGSNAILNPGVTLPNVIPALMMVHPTHYLMIELVAWILFEFGQSPKAITEASRGGQTLPKFVAELALSKETRDEC